MVCLCGMGNKGAVGCGGTVKFNGNYFGGCSMKSYYRLLRETIDTVNDKVRNCEENTKEYMVYFECQRILAEVTEYVLHFAKTDKLNEKIQTFWNLDLQYAETSEVLGCSYQSLRVIIGRQSRLTYEALGVVLLDLLRNGKPLDAYTEFLVRTDRLSLETMIPKEILLALPRGQYDGGIDLKDCKAELDFLKSLTKKGIMDSVRLLDEKRLAHVLSVLWGEGDYFSATVRKSLWSYLYGKEAFKTVINGLKVKNLIS